jgi:putative transposase
MCRRECGGVGSAAVEQAILDVSAVVGERQACKQFGVPRASFQRHQVFVSVERETALLDQDAIAIAVQDPNSKLSRQVRHYLARKVQKTARLSARALTIPQRQALLDAVHQTRFIDRSVPFIYATLLDENLYYGSISTMYRVLRSVGEVGERRDQATRPAHVKPELCATAPNQVYAWDITKLHGPQKWNYLYLYVVIDIYSRYVVGWMIADRESSALAKLLLKTTIREQGADPTKLIIHADRGSSMTSKPVAFMLADLGVTKSHSRPHVSNDNPHIESLFKTTKYQPQFPATFANIVEARAFCRAFFAWYNNEHRHSGIALLTPSDVHHGRVEEKTKLRKATLDAAYDAHPERFVRGRSKPLELASSYINRPPTPSAQPVPAEMEGAA